MEHYFITVVGLSRVQLFEIRLMPLRMAALGPLPDAAHRRGDRRRRWTRSRHRALGL